MVYVRVLSLCRQVELEIAQLLRERDEALPRDSIGLQPSGRASMGSWQGTTKVYIQLGTVFPLQAQRSPNTTGPFPIGSVLLVDSPCRFCPHPSSGCPAPRCADVAESGLASLGPGAGRAGAESQALALLASLVRHTERARTHWPAREAPAVSYLGLLKEL